MKKYFLLILFVLFYGCFNENQNDIKATDSTKVQIKTEVKLLFEKSDAEAIKDSMVALGWTFRENFPFFHKKVKTGGAPKSCTFSPDNKFIYVTLLNDFKKGVEIFSVDSMKKIKEIKPTCKNKKDNFGYAEGTFNKLDGSFWFTRMATGEFFVYKNDTLETYKANGVWTKIIEFSPDFSQVAMSHWVSNTFSIFEVDTRKHYKTIKTGKTPRGIAWINDSTVAVTLFGNGDLQVFNIKTGKLIHTFEERGAMRDVRYDPNTQILYMGNMGTNLVYKYSWEEKKLLATEKVDSHPNTIKLTPDCKYLYVSCRGPNNPKGYVNRSPRNGEFSLIQTSDFKTLATWTAGNQPTGLDVSPNGIYLVATDFNDNMLNLYVISK